MALATVSRKACMFDGNWLMKLAKAWNPLYMVLATLFKPDNNPEESDDNAF